MPDVPSDGILLIDKPIGITSFAVIRRLRRALDIRKIGHAGTLDPLASGLLVLGVGAGTKQLAKLVGLDKTYAVTIRVGEQRDTGDLEGEVIAQDMPDSLPEDDIRRVLEEIVGELELPVPAYAAVKQGGEPLYKKARRGEQVEAPIRTMKVHSAAFVSLQRTPEGFFEIECVLDVASGVYIRAVVEEIGRRLGYPATTATLRRTRVGDYVISDAYTLDAFKIDT